MDPACLKGEDIDLPRCSWSRFCNAMGIANHEWAKELLDNVAAHYKESGRPGLPEEVRSKADEINKDHYVFFVWLLYPDFVGRLDGIMPDTTEDPTNPDNYYMLNLLRKNCNDTKQDWKQIAKEVMDDKERYHLVRLILASRMGLIPVTLDVGNGKFDD